MKFSVRYFLVGLLLMVGNASCEMEGAPEEACETMTPGHSDTQAQMNDCPYEVVVEKRTMYSGESILVSVAAKPSTTTKFKGFMLMAFDATEDHTPIGEFTILPGETGAQTKDCPDMGRNLYVTHTGPEDKDSVEAAYWKPPSGYVGAVIFKTTFVQDFFTYWIKETSAFVTVLADPTTTTATSPTDTSTSTTASTSETETTSETAPSEQSTLPSTPSTTTAGSASLSSTWAVFMLAIGLFPYRM